MQQELAKAKLTAEAAKVLAVESMGCLSFRIVLGGGGRKPPNPNMAIALWIAQLLLDYIKSANNVLESELEHQTRRNKELQANLDVLNSLADMYRHSIEAINNDNERLKKEVDDIRTAHDQVKFERNEARRKMEAELEAMTDEQVLRGKV